MQDDGKYASRCGAKPQGGLCAVLPLLWMFRQKFCKMVFCLVLCDAAVFDGFFWTTADTSHTMGAGMLPVRFAVCQNNIAKGADPFTLAAADALSSCIKLFGRLHQPCPDRIERDRQYSFGKRRIAWFQRKLPAYLFSDER